MILIDAIPQDIQFVMNMNKSDIKNMKIILDNMVFNYDSSKPAHVEAKKYLEKTLYPLIEDILKEM